MPPPIVSGPFAHLQGESFGLLAVSVEIRNLPTKICVRSVVFLGAGLNQTIGCGLFISRAFPGIAGQGPKGISPPSQNNEFFLTISILICVRVIFSGDPLVDQDDWLILAETVKIHSLTLPQQLSAAEFLHLLLLNRSVQQSSK